MTPEQTAAQVKMLAEAGVDFIKDDELQADGPHCPFDERVPAVLRVLSEYARENRQTADVCGQHHRRNRPDAAPPRPGRCARRHMRHGQRQQRGTCPRLTALRRHAQVAIHGHRNGWGMLSRSHATGMSFIALSKILAACRHRPRPREWPAQQILRRRCERDRIGARVPHAHVSRAAQRLRNHAGLLFGPVRAPGAGHVQGAWLDGSDLRLRRRNSRPSRRSCRRRAQPAPGVASGGCAASRWPNMRRATTSCAPRWRRLPREHRQPSARPLYAWYGDDFTGSTDVLEALALNGVKAVLFTHTPDSRELGGVF